MQKQEKFLGCLIGLAAGDAVGTTVEFRDRGTFEPVTDMVGGGPFHLEPGQWTDDTSLALCLAASLVEKQTFDACDQMERYVRWMQSGYMSSTGACFDIGSTTLAALQRYLSHGNPYSGIPDPRSAGNGSIMRLAPIPMFYARSHAQAIEHAANSSKTTHAAPECMDACRLLTSMLVTALNGEIDKERVLSAPLLPPAQREQLSPAIKAIMNGGYRSKSADDISGSGYVVQSLEAALWCFWQTDSYEEAILTAVNLGDDADTTAAVCGQIAGAYYDVTNIPERWRAQLSQRDLIEQLALDLYAASFHS